VILLVREGSHTTKEPQNLLEPAFDVSTIRRIDSLVVPQSRIDVELAESHAWWLWWNLLSLDAPTVAVLWASVFAQASAIRLTYAEYTILALSVWIIYVCDRLLDVWRSYDRAALPARHRFCFRYSRMLLAALVLASAIIVYLAAAELSARECWWGLLLAAVVALYMIAIHAKPSFLQKELVVGILFATGTTLALWSRNISFFWMARSSWAAFALLCSLNCLSIECWEQPRTEKSHCSAPAGLIAWVNSHFTGCALVIGAFAFVTALSPDSSTGSRLSLLAVSLGAMSLLLIHSNRRVLSRSALRVLADAALVVPALLFWMVQQ
jgi:hypothetical protein